jgi:putative SOS response-associated peptidase YedK
MCERYVLPAQEDAERELQPVQRWWKFVRSFNVSAGRYVPAVRAYENSSEGVMMRWGLIPPEAEGIPPAREQGSFAAERLVHVPESREPWLNGQRCILPAAGFYGWRLMSGGYRQPYFIVLPERPVFGIAAIWTRSVTEEDDVIESCAMITVTANGLVEQITGKGGRMPAILHQEDYATWLRGTPVQAQSLLCTLPDSAMDAYPVSPRVNSLKYNDPALIESVA